MTNEGVTIEFLSQDKLETDRFEEKLEFVLEKVKNNHVLVLEESWSAEEKSQLIQYSLKEAEEDFPGVEFWALNSSESKLERTKDFVYEKILKDKKRRGITIVGNSRVMEKVKDERDSVSFLARLEEDK